MEIMEMLQIYFDCIVKLKQINHDYCLHYCGCLNEDANQLCVANQYLFKSFPFLPLPSQLTSFNTHYSTTDSSLHSFSNSSFDETLSCNNSNINDSEQEETVTTPTKRNKSESINESEQSMKLSSRNTMNENSKPQTKKQSKKLSSNSTRTAISKQPKGLKNGRLFMCQWCVFKCKWKFEIMHHMKWYHAREKPFRCSACSYMSNWKWDVEKHKKKYHADDSNARVIEVPDSVLFPGMTEIKYYELRHNGSDKNSMSIQTEFESLNRNNFDMKNIIIKEKIDLLGQNNQNYNEPLKYESKDLYCSECPFATNISSELKRHSAHLHTNSQPYQCFSCGFKCKWKNELRDHIRLNNHNCSDAYDEKNTLADKKINYYFK